MRLIIPPKEIRNNIDKSRYKFSRTPTFEVIGNDTGQDFNS